MKPHYLSDLLSVFLMGGGAITKEFLLLIILFPTKFMFSINIWKHNIGLNSAQCRHSNSINQKSYKETCNISFRPSDEKDGRGHVYEY